MDLHGFKEANDTHAPSLGDQGAARPSPASGFSSWRFSDFLARDGGDELTLILQPAPHLPAVGPEPSPCRNLHKYQFPLPGGDSSSACPAELALYPLHAMSGTDLLRVGRTTSCSTVRRRTIGVPSSWPTCSPFAALTAPHTRQQLPGSLLSGMNRDYKAELRVQ